MATPDFLLRKLISKLQLLMRNLGGKKISCLTEKRQNGSFYAIEYPITTEKMPDFKLNSFAVILSQLKGIMLAVLQADVIFLTRDNTRDAPCY